MAWYVFALADRPPRGGGGRGFSSAVVARSSGVAYVLAERRADVPPLAFDALRQHDRIVSRLAGRVPALLPVRFGTLLDAAGLAEALRERDDELAEAFDLVRGRCQMTWRRMRSRRVASRTPAPGVDPTGTSGAEYLRRRAAAVHPPLPRVFHPVHRALAPVVACERFEPAVAGRPDALYHLIDRVSSRAYRGLADDLKASVAGLTVTGPWPPYAFTPEWL